MERRYLSKLIAPSFYGVHRDIRRRGHGEYWLAGGRGSGKSSFLSIELLLEMLRSVSKDGLGGIQFNIREAGTHDAVQVFGYRQNYEQLDGEVKRFIKERTGHQIL